MKLSEKLGLGTVQFGLTYGISNTSGKTLVDEVQKIIDIARKHQLDMLDSASAYGDAEEVLGKSNLSGFKVVSKFLPPALGPNIKEQLHQSLSNLGIKSLYGLLAHRPMDLLEHPEQWDELQSMKFEGKVGKIGFSLNEPEEIDRLLAQGFIPDLVQVPYNYFDRRFKPALIELKETGCEIHTRSAFLQGLFFLAPRNLDNYFAEIKPVLKEIHQSKEPLPGRLLKFVIDNPFIDKVIIGVENSYQLEQNIAELENASSLPQLNMKISDNILIPSRWPKK